MRRTSQAFALGSMLGSLVLGSSALAQDGPEVDLTGTWEGAQICDDLTGGELSNFVIVDNPLLVVQDGDTFRFVYVGHPEEEVADDLVYEGVIQPVEGSDHFEALAGVCGGDYKAEEIVRLRRIEISETAARFDAEFHLLLGRLPVVPGGSHLRDLQVGVRAGLDGAAGRAGVPATRHSPDETMKATNGLVSRLCLSGGKSRGGSTPSETGRSI